MSKYQVGDRIWVPGSGSWEAIIEEVVLCGSQQPYYSLTQFDSMGNRWNFGTLTPEKNIDDASVVHARISGSL